MPTRKKVYGPQEGVDTAYTGSPRLSGATIRQTGFDAPAGPRQAPARTYTLREAAGRLMGSGSKPASKPASQRSKVRKGQRKR